VSAWVGFLVGPELLVLFSPRVLPAVRVLLIHAGGYSKRLPNVSVIGKIFATLPLGTLPSHAGVHLQLPVPRGPHGLGTPGEPLYQMLEAKLAMYIDFPAQMAPGVRAAAASGELRLAGSRTAPPACRCS
jgi:hypothetical protein